MCVFRLPQATTISTSRHRAGVRSILTSAQRVLNARFKQGGKSCCHFWWKNDRPPSEAFLVEGLAHFLTKGGKKTPLDSKRPPQNEHINTRFKAAQMDGAVLFLSEASRERFISVQNTTSEKCFSDSLEQENENKTTEPPSLFLLTRHGLPDIVDWRSH